MSTAAAGGSLPIDNLINVNSPSPSSLNGAASSMATSSSSSAALNTAIGSQLGPGAFLTLLTTELKNQDPLNPMDDTQSIAQLANFSTLQSQQNLTSAFQTFQQNFSVVQSASMIGKTVTVSDPSTKNSTMSGKISGVQVQNNVPYYTLVDSSGKPINDSGGKPLQVTGSQIESIGS